MPEEQSGQAPVKRKRRTRAEMEAARAAEEAARNPQPQAQPVALPQSEKLSPIGAMAMLAENNIKPTEYMDLYDLMKDCIRVRRQYNLSDNQFLELMNRFDDRVVEKKGKIK